MKKVLLLILLSQILFFVLIPPFQIPDEPGHYENVFWLAKGIYPYEVLKKGVHNPAYFEEIAKYYPTHFNLSLLKNSPLRKKIITDFEKNLPKNFIPVNFQSYHPFLYYLLLTPAMHLANIFKLDLISRFYLTRVFSTFFFWIIIVSVIKILNLLKVNTKDQKTFLLLFGLNPLVLNYSIGINPDIAVAAFSYLLLYFVLKLRNSISLKSILLFGFLAGLSYLAKTSGLSNLAFVALVLFFKRKNLFSFIKNYFIFFFSFLLTSSPWIYLHISRYKTMSTPSFYIAYTGKIAPNNFFKSLSLAALEFRHTIMHYAGFLGAQNHIWPPKFYFIGFTVIAVVLFAVGFKNYWKKYRVITFYFTSAMLFFFLLAFYFYKSGLLWDIQGRFFLLNFFPFYFFVFFGVKKIFKFKKINLMITLFFLSNFYWIIFSLIIPRFYSLSNLLGDLNLVYDNFGYLFIGALISNFVLALFILRYSF